MDLTVVSGSNFSGRTAHLREWVGLPNDAAADVRATENAYVGPDSVSALSGLTHSVQAEFELMGREPADAQVGLAALEEIGLDYVSDQNPFTLSGGEQVVVAIIAATLARPKRLAIDCAMEQLAPETRALLLTWLARREGAVMIADNRLDEWHDGATLGFGEPEDAPKVAPHPRDSEGRPAHIVEIVDLCFRYPSGRKVFDGFSLTLPAGSQHRLAGRNGAGKTTLSKLLCGILKPQGGEIRIDGKRVEPWRRPGGFVSYHFQNPSFQLFATSVASQLRAAKDPGAAAANFGLPNNLATHPLDYPYVLRKRLALATALLRGLDFVIADEPTLGQDSAAASSIAGLLDDFGGLRISHSRKFDHLETVSL